MMQVIDEALSESIDAVTPHALDLVHNSKQNLRLDQDMAVKILSRAVRAGTCPSIWADNVMRSSSNLLVQARRAVLVV